jgi:preprotein translocase subunit SecD
MRCLIRFSLLRLFFFLFLFSLVLCGCGPRRPEHGMEFLVVVGTNQASQVSSHEMQAVVKALGKRVDAIGRPWSVERSGDNRISVKIDPDTKEQIEQARLLLTRIGRLEFRLVHEESEKLLRDGIIPPGYEMLNESRVTRTGSKTIIPHLINRKPPAGMSGQKFSRVWVDRNALGDPEVHFAFDPEGAAAFERVTTENVDRQLAIVLDREIYSAPRIRGPITGGHGSITGSFSDDEARLLAMILSYPLETPAKLVEERRF